MRRRRSRPRRPSGLEPGVPLSRLEWSRRDTDPRRPPTAKRFLALVVAAVEAGLLIWLLAGPAFALKSVQVTGARHLTAGEVTKQAGLIEGASVLGLDVDTIRRKLQELPWVRAATVTPVLPDRVVIGIAEWRAVAAYRFGGKLYLLNGQGDVLEQVPPPTGLPLIDGPARQAPRPGARMIAPALLTAIVNMQAAFPGATGRPAKSFKLDACGALTAYAGGFRVIFGRVLTVEQYQALGPKFDALSSLRSKVNFASPDLDYINVENPSAPAVHYRSAKPPPSPTPGGLPQASPTPQVQVIGCR